MIGRGVIKVAAAGLFALIAAAGAAQAQVGPYENAASAALNAATACPATVTRTIAVAPSFTIADLDVGFLASHTYRSDIQLDLTSPAGTTVRLLNGLGVTGFNYDNYNVLLNDESATLVNNGFHAANDGLAAPPYQSNVRPNNPLSAFDGQNASGTWTLTMCDSYGPQDDGQFLRANLYFNGADLSLTKTASTATPVVNTDFTYTITLTNAGPTAATGVSVKDLLPPGISHISNNGAGAYVPATGVWTIAGAISSGGTRSLQITARALYNGGYTNTAEVWSSAAADPDSTPANGASAEDDMASVTVTASGGAPPPPLCAAGQLLVSQTGNAVAQTNTGVANPALAVGALSAAGTTPPDSVAALINDASDTLVLDLGVVVPKNGAIILSAARNGGGAGNNGRIDIEFSADGVSYASVGTYGAAPATYASAAQDVLERVTLASPIYGARYLRFRTQNSDDVFVDGLQYGSVCLSSPTLVASKTVTVFAPGGFATPGADVVYTLTVRNSGSGGVDADTLFIVDSIPANVEFFNGDMDGAGPATGAVYFTQSGAGLAFSLASDVRYSNAVARPTSFAACTYTPSAGYDPNVRHLCLNPKGAMAAGSPDPSFSAQFRVRIK